MRTPLLAGVLVLLGGVGYFLYPQVEHYIAPCSEPLTYALTQYDARFGISEAAFADALADAAALLNDAAGKEVIVAAQDADISVVLSYGDEQRAAQLGKTISAEQAAYDTARAQVESLRAGFIAQRRTYERSLAAFERRADAYDKEVGYWNDRGGAPPAEYEQLQQEGIALQAEQEVLEKEARDVNTAAQNINEAVEELNLLAQKLNSKVAIYNQDAGEDFDQGRYVQEGNTRTIYIYEFTDGTELRRVLAHEFGHALGMDHVENPESIMYSYNIGDELELTPEDVAELSQTCRLE